MAEQYTPQRFKRLVDEKFAYPKIAPITALDGRQVFYALIDSVPFLADGGFATLLPTWTPTPPAVPNLFAKDAPVVYDGVLYRAKRLIADSRNAPGTYVGSEDDWEVIGGLGGEGADAVFPDDAPPVATQQGNLPAGYQIAGKPVVDVLLQQYSEPYRTPQFNKFLIDGQGSQNVEVGTSFITTFKGVEWGTTFTDNVADHSVFLRDETAGADRLLNEENDGQASFAPVAFSATGPGLVRHYRLRATNSQGGAFAADIYYNAYYRFFYGPVTQASTSSTEVRALPNNQLTVQGTQIILNSGTAQRIFEIDVPPGYVVQSVVDLDNLNQVITADYVGSALSVNDAGGTARTYRRYVKTQAVPYSSNHRHQITLVNG